MKIYIVVFVTMLLLSCGNTQLSHTEIKAEVFEDIGGGDEGGGSQNHTDRVLKNQERASIFESSGLFTNTGKSSIDLGDILNGGPGKDGIPAINTPKFYSIAEAQEKIPFLDDESLGISVEHNGVAKFYAYNILVWHEIVNDIIGEKNIAVTFCPLCGSAIVYNRDVDGEELKFGVSGKLYESNLLMYDDVTESLWSQSIGEALVGDKLGTSLEHVGSNFLTFGEFQKNYATGGMVLSDDTGFDRNYNQIPYGKYTDDDALYFPIKNSDERFHAKEMFYIVNNNGESVAFLLKDLREQKNAEIIIEKNTYTADFDNGIIEVRVNGNVLAGYYEMWFSWATYNKGNKNIWKQ